MSRVQGAKFLKGCPTCRDDWYLGIFSQGVPALGLPKAQTPASGSLLHLFPWGLSQEASSVLGQVWLPDISDCIMKTSIHQRHLREICHPDRYMQHSQVCKDVHQHPWLSPLDASSTLPLLHSPVLTSRNVSRHCPTSLRKQDHP